MFLLLIYEFKTATSYSFFLLSLSRVQHFRGGMITINPNLPKIITSTFLPHTPHLTSCSQEDQDILLGLKEAVISPILHCWITSSILSLSVPWLCMNLNPDQEPFFLKPHNTVLSDLCPPNFTTAVAREPAQHSVYGSRAPAGAWLKLQVPWV